MATGWRNGSSDTPGIGQTDQPAKAVGPQGDRFETRRPRRLLEAGEGRGGAIGRNGQQRAERRHVFRRQPRRNPLATRYEKTAYSFMGVLCLAAALDWLKC